MVVIVGPFAFVVVVVVIKLHGTEYAKSPGEHRGDKCGNCHIPSDPSFFSSASTSLGFPHRLPPGGRDPGFHFGDRVPSLIDSVSVFVAVSLRLEVHAYICKF